MSLDLDGSLNIAANVQVSSMIKYFPEWDVADVYGPKGELSTGRQTLATIPLAGLAFSIPG